MVFGCPPEESSQDSLQTHTLTSFVQHQRFVRSRPGKKKKNMAFEMDDVRKYLSTKSERYKRGLHCWSINGDECMRFIVSVSQTKVMGER